MYTLSQVEPLKSCYGTVYIVAMPWLEEKYLSAGYKKSERSYKLIYQHNEYTILCPEYKNCELGVSPVVIIPVYLIPRRPYPVQVYLYAIDLYSNNPAMGQREAAETTRKHFGLQHFAHTTLGRALKAFVRNIEAVRAPSEYCGNEVYEPDVEGAHQDAGGAKSNEGEQKSDTRKQSGIPTTQATGSWRKQAARFLEVRIISRAPKQFIEACFKLAKEWFNKFGRFLL